MSRAGLLVVLLGFLPGVAGAQGIGIGVGIGNALAGKPRGRLVVACDMRSDTCSDGRQITTTRSTPVPCETSPGVWEMVPEDTGCYSVRGLESWAANTSYLSWGAELDRSPWGPSVRGGTLEALSDGWRVHKNLDQPNSGWIQRVTGMGDGTMWTTSYILRTMTPIPMAMYAGSSQSCGQETLDTGGRWQTLSCSREVPAPSDPAASIYPGANTTGTPYSVDVKAAWTVRGAAPGRPCWGGEAPVTCDADRHTISTEGWPTTEGEISFTYTNMKRTWSGESIFIADGNRFQIKAVTDGRIRVFLNGVGTTLPDNPPWHPVDQVQHIHAVLRAGSLEVFVNGVSVGSVETGPIEYSGTAMIGTTGTLWANGSIRSLRVRSFE